MKKFRELREDWRVGKLEREIFHQECGSMKTFDDSKWTNKQEEYHKKREEMLDYDSFEEFVSTVSSRQPSQEPRSTYRDQLLNRLEIEFNSMPMRTLKNICQRLATQPWRVWIANNFASRLFNSCQVNGRRTFCY